MRRPAPLLLLLIGLALLACAQAAPASVSDPLIQGELPNGFRYAFLPRTGEPGRISLRLIVHAGSLDERADESGCAHFVEHMAYNGTKHYPPRKLVPVFQRLGLAFGPDANAGTSYTSTIYRIDLPAGRAQHLPEALQIFADFAGGILFQPAEVRHERSVIVSEIRARDNDEWQRWRQFVALAYSGTAVPDRPPPGDVDAVERTDAAKLRGFYQRCYRPERMTLLIVGDITPAELTPLLETNFGALRAVGPRVDPAPLPAPTAPPLATAVITTPLATACRFEAVSVVPLADDSDDAICRRFGDTAVLALLNRRLDARRAADRRLGAAQASIDSGIDERFLHYSLSAHAGAPDWNLTVSVVETELRRARVAGFADAEVRETVTGLLASLRAEVAAFSGLPADQLANRIAPVLAARRQWRPPAAQLTLAQSCFASFSPASAAERLHAIFGDGQLRLSLLARVAPPGGVDAVRAAWQTSGATALDASAPAVPELVNRYTDFGPPGAVEARVTAPDLGVTALRFANGVRLNLRPSTAEPGRFELRIRLGRGTADIPSDQPGIHCLAAALLSRCDLVRQTREELRRLFTIHALEGSWNMADNQSVLIIVGPAAELPFALSVVAAQLGDPKLEPERLADAVSIYPALVGQMLTTATGYTRAETVFRASGEDPRWRLATQAEVQRYSYDSVVAWLRRHWLAGPIEIGLAGDFDSALVETAAAATVGTLVARPDPAPAAPNTYRSRSYRNLNFVVLPDQAATVRLFWPARDLASITTARLLEFAAASLEEDFRVLLREELGVTYSPSASVYRDALQPDFGFLTLTLTLPPADALALTEKSITLASRFGKKGLNREQFSRLREPLLSTARAQLRSNDWWLEHVLLYAQTRPEVLDDARTHATAFDAITREQVNRLLADILQHERASCVGFIPQASQLPAKR